LGEQCGKKGLSLGTLGVRENGKTLEDFGLTSPSLIDLRKYIHRFGQHKDFCVMEVSSHALSQMRIYGLEFSAAGWPSFSQDHLDYHKTIEAYAEAKSRLFAFPTLKYAVINLDDEHSDVMLNAARHNSAQPKIFTYAIQQHADFYVSDLS
jgi:UDP-N-acetylmuramoyl-L-alanyl-D-glutamate--2,6-diaminopimelate ligase